MSSIDRGVVLQQLDRLFRDGTLAGLGDGQLLERYRTRRDEAAFEALVELHGPMVLGLCRRFLRDPRDVEDAFQATFLVLVRKAPGIRDGGLLANWLYGVALRVATRSRANLLRRRVREQSIGQAEFAADMPGGDAFEFGPMLDQELSRLPAKYRAPLVLCYLRGQTHDQAARELRCPVGTVRSRMARGRDLLKRRLSRQGFAPTGAFFGPGLDFPAHLLTEAVPARLVAATVEGAFAIGSSQSIQAGAAAASVLALTQGVVTSMKFAQLKWIGLALMATGLSAGGAIGLAAASAQDPTAASGTSSSVVTARELPQATGIGTTTATTSTGIQTTSRSTEERLRGLESQIGRIYQLAGVAEADEPAAAPDASTLDRLEAKLKFLLSHHDATGARTSPTATSGSASRPDSPGAASSATGRATSASASSGSTSTSTNIADPTSTSTTRTGHMTLPGESAGAGTKIRELEAQLKQAMRDRDRSQQLRQKAAISDGEYQDYRAKVDLALARLEGMDDDLAEEVDRLKLEVKRKKAEVEQANAQTGVVHALVARNQRLNYRKTGMVADEDVARAEAEFHAAQAGATVKAVELQESELQLAQFERRRTLIAKILESRTSSTISQ